MQYKKQNNVFGKWIKGTDVISGSKAKLVSEAKPMASQFKDKNGGVKMQDVAKIQFEQGGEPFNISINRASLNALMDAFGEDSVKWQGHELTVVTEKVVVAGKRVTAVYLVPNGYELGEDSNGYVVITKGGEKVESSESPEIEVGDAPF